MAIARGDGKADFCFDHSIESMLIESVFHEGASARKILRACIGLEKAIEKFYEKAAAQSWELLPQFRQAMEGVAKARMGPQKKPRLIPRAL